MPEKDPMILRANRYPEYRKIYSQLPEYVQKILYAHKLKVKRIKLWRRGISSFVFQLINNHTYALKISPRYSLNSEIYFFQKAKTAGFPIPKIIIADTTKKLIPYDFQITEWINGKTPDELSKLDLYKCSFKLGQMFTEIHKIKTTGFGFPITASTWSHKAWLPALRDFIYREVRPSQIRNLFGGNMLNFIEMILKDRRMNISQPSLLHSDAGEDQFIVEKKENRWIINSILDPGYSIAGDPIFDLAIATLYWNAAEYRNGFYEGYISLHNLREEERYRFQRLRFLGSVWAATLINRINKQDGKSMIGAVADLAKKFNLSQSRI